MVNTTTQMAGVAFSSYTMNAAVPLTLNIEGMHDVAASHTAAVLIKSVTIDPRIGNEEPFYATLPGSNSLNSVGLKNEGYKTFLPYPNELKKYNKPIFISISGFSPEEYREMTAAFSETDVDFIELNLSCPNAHQGIMAGYDLKQIQEILGAVADIKLKKIGVKVPPYPDAAFQMEVAKLIKAAKLDFITSINTLGNSLYIDPNTDATVMKATRGFGGLAGSCLKPIALGNVRRFYEFFEGEVAIIGCGGISNGRDAFDFLLAGADLVQVGTAAFEQGVDLFAKIDAELKGLLADKGYESIAAAKGKLKFM